MVDSSTQTPRDEDSAKPEEEVIIEDAETTGAAPNIMEQDSKEGNLVLLYYLELHLRNGSHEQRKRKCKRKRKQTHV